MPKGQETLRSWQDRDRRYLPQTTPPPQIQAWVSLLLMWWRTVPELMSGPLLQMLAEYHPISVWGMQILPLETSHSSPVTPRP